MSTTATENPQVTQSPEVKPAEVKSTKPDFGQGRYSAEMVRIYDACVKLFSLTPVQSEKIARDAAADAGAVFRNSSATISVSKVGKNGQVTIADASKVKGVTVTNPLHIIRAIQWIDDAMKNGVSYGHTKWRLSPLLQEWVDKIEVKA